MIEHQTNRSPTQVEPTTPAPPPRIAYGCGWVGNGCMSTLRSNEKDAKTIAIAGMVSALVTAESWFKAALDATADEDGVTEGDHWFNGESSKYAGNGWDEAHKTLDKVRAAFNAWTKAAP